MATQKPVVIFAHSENPPLTKLIPTLERIGHKPVVFRTPFMEFPDMELEDIHGVIVMGAPISIYQWPDIDWLRKELVWVEKAVKRGLPVFGICFGCQMLAHITGGEVKKGDKGFEFGFSKQEQLIKDDPIFGTDMNGCQVFQAHGDTYVLPEQAVQYGEGELYHQQAAKFGDKLYGVQFHPEVCRETITRWYKSREERGRNTPEDPSLEKMLQTAEDNLPCIHNWLEKFLSRLFA